MSANGLEGVILELATYQDGVATFEEAGQVVTLSGQQEPRVVVQLPRDQWHGMGRPDRLRVSASWAAYVTRGA